MSKRRRRDFKAERNEEMIKLERTEEFSHTELAKKYGISRERVRQICGKYEDHSSTTNCAWCGRTFTKRHPRQHCCSKQCHGKWTYRQKHPLVTKICPQCFKKFKTGKVRKKFCSYRCCVTYNQNSVYYKRLGIPRPPTKLRKVKCVECGKVFYTTKRKKKFCCTAHAHRYHARVRYDKRRKDHPLRKCDFCGAEFIPWSYRHRFCNSNCRSKQYHKEGRYVR